MKSAGGAKKSSKSVATVKPESATGMKKDLSPLQRAVVELYGRGFRRIDVAKTMVKYLAPKSRYPEASMDYRLRRARSKLAKWEKEQWFRDMLFQTAVIDTDLATKDIMRGVVKEAKRGRVDAAKFAMEVAGRYTPKAEEGNAPVVIVFPDSLPRPMRDLRPADVEGDAEEVHG